jgi:oxygen-independent coproporphyrinogen III oxidase
MCVCPLLFPPKVWLTRVKSDSLDERAIEFGGRHDGATSLADLSLYLHIPFCDKKCSYCDFNSYAGIDNLMPAYAEALVREIELWSVAGQSFDIKTIFFGGGTPSRMPLEEMSQIFDALMRRFTLKPDCEISLEANPGTVTLEYLRGLRDLGVNRLSFGVQSFHDDELLFLDRIHSAQEAEDAYLSARKAGYDNINLDLIYGLPDQPMDRWQGSLERAIGLQPEHLSLYALTVEDGTGLGAQVARGEVKAPDPDAAVDQYEWTIERMSQAGFEHYEISNWALPGRRCFHNLTYWRNEPYLGMGAGAHSFFRGVRFAVVSAPNRYIHAMNESWESAKGGSAGTDMRQIGEGEQMTPKLEMSDTIILGLRLAEGLNLRQFEDRYGVPLLLRYQSEIRELTEFGLLEVTDDSLRLTDRGRNFHNEVAVRFLPDAVSV